jgi:hypothetical protein
MRKILVKGGLLEARLLEVDRRCWNCPFQECGQDGGTGWCIVEGKDIYEERKRGTECPLGATY